jgi:Secretion system C-terminal sorting domain/Putative metal-binding motif/Fibronectin type III domain
MTSFFTFSQAFLTGGTSIFFFNLFQMKQFFLTALLALFCLLQSSVFAQTQPPVALQHTIHATTSSSRTAIYVAQPNEMLHLDQLIVGESYTLALIGKNAQTKSHALLLNPKTGAKAEQLTFDATATNMGFQIVDATPNNAFYVSLNRKNSPVIAASSEKSMTGIMPNTDITPEAWVQQLVGNANCLISNVTYCGGTTSLASFTGGSASIGISEGLLLTTGNANTNITGPNSASSMSSSSTNPCSNLTDLDLLSDGTLHDGVKIEFDFTPTSPNAAFKFVFASEEYNEFVNSDFNDIFGFFVSGPGINGTLTNGAMNVALVPGTTTPISINTVNTGSNSGFFVYSSSADLQFDGYTTPINANFTVIPGLTYHIVLAIADVSDGGWDSGVFFEASSFECGEPCNLTIECDENQVFDIGEACNLNVGLQQPSVCFDCGISEFTTTLSGATVFSVNDLPSGNLLFNSGTTVVTFEATDNNNNTTSCSYQVQVNGGGLTIACPQNQVLTATEDCQAVLEWSEELKPVWGGCGWPTIASTEVNGATIAEFDQINLPAFNVGVSTVTYSGTTAFGAPVASCSFTVTIISNQLTLICPPAITVQGNGPGCSSVVTGIDPILTDACGGPFADNTVQWILEGQSGGNGFGSASGTTFLPGSTAVIYSVPGTNLFCYFYVNVIPNSTAYYFDEDGDGYGNIETQQFFCEGDYPVDYVLLSGDCNDNVAGINPGATEICNNIDDNCNGAIDEGSVCCANPTTSSSFVLSTSAVLVYWPAIPGATNYSVRYRAVGTTAWITTTPTGGATYKQINSLSPNTTYQYQIRTYCNKAWLSYANPTYTCSTALIQSGCVAPSPVYATALSSTSLQLYWPNIAGAPGYQVQYRISTTSTWTTVNANTTGLTLTGLTPGALYYYRIRTKCTLVPVTYSPFSLVYAFSMPNVAQFVAPTVTESTTYSIESPVSLKLFPNPAVTELNIELQNFEATQLTIININGQKMVAIPAEKIGQSIDISQLASGIYLIQATDANGQIQSGQFVKE